MGVKMAEDFIALTVVFYAWALVMGLVGWIIYRVLDGEEILDDILARIEASESSRSARGGTRR